MVTSEDIYHRYQNGDEEALLELISRYRAPLIGFINRYVKDPFCAEDLAEDVFVALILHKHRYRAASSFKAYLYTIARNKAINFCRHRDRHPTLSLDDLPEKAATALSEDILLKKESYRELYKALGALKEEYRTALYLTYFEDMSADMAARVMKKSRKQVENLIFRARAALRQLLNKEDLL